MDTTACVMWCGLPATAGLTNLYPLEDYTSAQYHRLGLTVPKTEFGSAQASRLGQLYHQVITDFLLKLWTHSWVQVVYFSTELSTQLDCPQVFPPVSLLPPMTQHQSVLCFDPS